MRVWSNTLRKVCAGIAAIAALQLHCTSLSFAQAPADAPPTLNEHVLSRFADTWQPITDAISAHDGEFDRTHLPSLVQSLNALAASDGVDSALDKIVSGHGYSDFEAWVDIARHSIEAAQWAAQPPSEDELKRTISALQADPDIPADQKQSLVNDVSAAFQTALDNKPSEANIAAAKAVLPLLEPIIKPDK